MGATKQPQIARLPVGRVFVPSIVAAYIGLMLISRLFFFVRTFDLAMIWPAAGISVFALLRVSGRIKLLVLACIGLANLTVNVMTVVPPVTSAGYALANIIESLLVAELIVRLSGPFAQLRRVRDLFCIVLASFTGAAVGGSIGAVFADHPPETPHLDIWWHWTTNHTMGVVLVLLVLLGWNGDRGNSRAQRKWFLFEATGFVAVLAVTLYLVFGNTLDTNRLLPLATLPVLIWSAWRLPLRYTTVGNLMLTLAATLGTKSGYGIFAILPYPVHIRIASAVFFAAVIVGTTTLVALVIAEQERAHEKSRASEERYRKLIDTAEEGIWITAADLSTSFVNTKMADMLGYTVEEMIGRSAQPFSAPDNSDRAIAVLAQRSTNPERKQLEWKFQRKDGKPLWGWLSISPIIDAEGKWAGDVAMVSDITDRKRAEKEREMTIEFLRLVNESSGSRQLVRATAKFFQRHSGCEAVGIRLRDGDDYPYCQARGFPQEFVLAENSLCGKSFGGDCSRDRCDDPILECMCGNVIQGRSNPSKPFFTASGSFWTNSTTELLNTTTDADRGTRTRNRCNGEGYESVALIPLCVGGQRLGLLQLNDRRRGVFSQDLIAYWERLAGYLAVALAKCHSEEALKQSERKHRMLLEQASDAIFSIDFSGKVLAANAKTCEMLGYTLEELLQCNVRDIISERDQHITPLAFEPIRYGRTVLLESTYCRKDGTPIAVETSAKRTSDNVIQVIARDVTNRKRTEEALQRSEERFRMLIENAPYGIYQCTPGGRLLSVNPRLVELLGYESEEELVSRNIAEAYCDPAQREHLVQVVEREGEIRGTEVLWKRKDGKCITVRLSARHMPGHPDFEVIAEDISETVELEAELRQAQKLEALGALAGGIAHDFNNLLMIINAYTETILAQLDAELPIQRQIKKIMDAANRGSNLTRQLLAFSRKQVLDTTVITLDTVIAEVRNMLRPLIGESITLDVRSSPNLWRVRADRGQVEQIIFNLAVNARDAMPKGGTLTIGTRNVQLEEDSVQKHKIRAGQYVELYVEDTGCGMSPEIQSRIFDPFFTTKEMGKGTGLGLSTVYGIVKQSDGYITVDSREGIGTIFHVYLPRTSDQEIPELTTQQVRTPPCSNTRILVVEDEGATREAIRDYLEQAGFAVIVAANAVEALAVTESKCAPDVILTDVVLPGDLGGPALVQELCHRCPGAKVIFMSGYTDDRISRRSLTKTGFRFMQKPFRLPDLVTTIQALLRKPE